MSLRALPAAAMAALFVPAWLGAQSADRVGFRARVAPDTIFVGQQATYSLTVQIPADVRQRLRRNPEFVPPEPRGMLAYELPLARSSATSEQAEVHTFRRALFVLSPGRYGIASARLSYAVPQSASFFSREEERLLRSEAVSFVAVDPPLRGRPDAWLGAVGSWRASARVEPADPRVGDPVIFTLRIEGEGNPTLLARPELVVPWADVVVDDEKVSLEAAPLLLGGAKEFTWLLTPRRDGLQRVDEVEYAFFDPIARAYAVARSNPVSLRVRPGTVVAVPPRAKALADSLPIGLRPSLGSAQQVGLPQPWVWAAAVLLAPLPWLLAGLRRRRQRRRAAAASEPLLSVRALFERGLRQHTGLDIGAFTTPGSLTAALRLEGVTPETAREAEVLRDACDTVVFAPGAAQAATSADRARAESLLKRIAQEARRRAPLLLFLLLSAGCTAPVAPEAAMTAFAEGQTAYRGNDFVRARDAFARAAAAAPRHPATWENLAAAAWHAADTAWAVVGWQRALRLDPRNAALRERLARVRAPQLRGAARIWPLPPRWVAALALGCWVLGWSWAYRARRSGRRSRLAAWMLVPAVVLGALALWLDSRLAARDLVVITQPTSLRALPALGSDRGAVPLGGEVARVLARRGVWLQLRLDGGREGWYPTERTQSLARD